MNKADLIVEVASETGMPYARTERIINTALEKVKEALANGESVRIPWLGTFKVRRRAPRKYRNPHTGEFFLAEETVQPVFKMSGVLKNYVAEKAAEKKTGSGE